jgi:hypothetical protein
VLVVRDDVNAPSRWPAWATWTLIGVGAAAVAGVTVGIDEAFQGQAPPHFEVGSPGLRSTTRRGGTYVDR